MIKAVVMDVEGTTTDIAFVHKVLFPYARARMADYVRSHLGEAQVAEALAAVSEEAGLAVDDTEGQIDALIRWIDEDRKVTPLKALQGLIWQHGYQNGDFTGHVYPEVPAALNAWQQQGLRLAVYSSGSVAAQKLLFGYSDAGDLQGLFEANFDTRIGHKREEASYHNIAKALGLPGRPSCSCPISRKSWRRPGRPVLRSANWSDPEQWRQRVILRPIISKR